MVVSLFVGHNDSFSLKEAMFLKETFEDSANGLASQGMHYRYEWSLLGGTEWTQRSDGSGGVA